MYLQRLEHLPQRGSCFVFCAPGLIKGHAILEDQRHFHFQRNSIFVKTILQTLADAVHVHRLSDILFVAFSVCAIEVKCLEEWVLLVQLVRGDGADNPLGRLVDSL